MSYPFNRYRLNGTYFDEGDFGAMPSLQAAVQTTYSAGYPLFLDICGKNVVVIGGGEVARRKIDTLLSYGAAVRVVSPAALARIAKLAESGVIAWERRPYQEGDLAGAVLAFCACGNPAVDEQVVAEAHRVNCLVNVVDVPEKCDFIVPSIVSRPPLSIAVSTAGAAPTEAKRIRQELEEAYDASWGPYLQLVGAVRSLVKQRIAGTEENRRPVYEASCSLNWQSRLAAGEHISAEAAYEEACTLAFGQDASFSASGMRAASQEARPVAAQGIAGGS